MIGQILSLKFEFNGEDYYALLRVKQKESWIEYHVTVMRGELEKILYGSHVLIETNGKVQVDDSVNETQEGRLRNQIIKALQLHLDTNKKLVEES